ncbi:unnamed protein product [Camellia sinensis]
MILQRQHSAFANSKSSYSGSADESSYSGSSYKSLEESTGIIPDPPMSWYPPGSLPSTSSSTGSTHDTTAGRSSRGPTLMQGSNWYPSGGILHIVPNELNQVVDGHTPLASRLEVKETNKKNGVLATHLEVWMAGYSKDNKPSTDRVAEVMMSLEMQMKEMMDAMLNQQKVQMDMQSTIQAQEARIEQLESQQAMGGPVAQTSTRVHSQQQSHAYTSSFNCHRSFEEVSSHIK